MSGESPPAALSITPLLSATLSLLLAAALAIALDVPALFDHEARYAEIAREMALGGDWITPHLDSTVFLNKPPLLYWLAAIAFSLGPPRGEWIRVVAIIATAFTLLATCRLGARLYGERTGLLAAVMLATMFGFAFEARTLSPDPLLVAAVTSALLCWHHADAGHRSRTRWLIGMYAALGVGVLTKGLVPVVVSGIPIAAMTLHAHGPGGFRRLRPGLGILVLAGIILPWHVVVALRHPGFAWDYLVNQHFLFFLDRKLPRDSEGDSLLVFWSCVLLRGLPWIAFLPLAARELPAGLRGDGGREARGTLLLCAWAGGVLVFFSCAPSRLEHYALPALPALALLAARGWERLRAGRPFVAAGAAVSLVGALCCAFGPQLFVGQAPQIPQDLDLAHLTTLGGIVLAVGGLLLALAAASGRPLATLAAVGVTTLPLLVLMHRGLVAAEPIFSWRPIAAALAAGIPADAEIVYEAPEEYQLVGGLVYYTERRITLLEIPGFVPPTYLSAEAPTMFLPRAEFARRWQSSERLVLVSDQLRHRETPEGLVPGPFHVLAHAGDRWVLTNFPAPTAG